MKQLRIICPDPAVDITVQMGDGPATPTAGFAAWEIIERAEGKGITDRASVPPFQQDVPVFLDGYAKGNSVQRQLDTLLELGGEEPAVFRAFGPIHRSGIHYVLGGEPEFGEVIRDEDGTLLRQRLTLRLMEYVRPDTLGQRLKKRRSRRGVATYTTGGSTYVTKAGETLGEIASRLYGNWERWREIGDKNGIRDPLRKLPGRRTLKL